MRGVPLSLAHAGRHARAIVAARQSARSDARRLVHAAALGEQTKKTLEEVRKKAAELATDAWMYEQPRSNLAVLSQLAPPKR